MSPRDESRVNRFVSPIPVEEATGQLLAFYSSLQAKRGHVPDLYRCLSPRSDLLVSTMDLAQKAYGSESALSRRTKEEIAAFVRGLVGRPEATPPQYSPLYSQRMNGAVLEPLGRADLDAATKAGLEKPERSLLELVAAVWKDGYQLTVDDIDRVRAEGWEDQAIFEAVFDGALFGLFVQVASAFGICDPSLDLESAEAGDAVAKLNQEPKIRSTWSF